LEGLGTHFPSLNEIAEYHNINHSMVIRRSADDMWNVKRREVWDEIKSKIQDLKTKDVSTEKYQTLVDFKPLEKEYASPKTEIGLSDELALEISESIIDSIVAMVLTIHKNDPSLTVPEIGSFLFYLHEMCLINFVDLSKNSKE
jgi:hypothetical protein